MVAKMVPQRATIVIIVLDGGDTGYRRLLGDSARSPIVETKLQFSLDINLAYRF